MTKMTNIFLRLLWNNLSSCNAIPRMRKHSDHTCNRHGGKKYQLDHDYSQRNESYLHSNAFKGSSLSEQTFSSVEAVRPLSKLEEYVKRKSYRPNHWNKNTWRLKIFVIMAAIIFQLESALSCLVKESLSFTPLFWVYHNPREICLTV